MKKVTEYLFGSAHLTVSEFKSLANADESYLAAMVIKLLSPRVVAALPQGWQTVDTPEKALSWLQQRLDESRVFAISLTTSDEIIGLIFIHHSQQKSEKNSVNIGYLLAEQSWGKGYATEVLSALVHYYKTQPEISTLYAGVEANNIASIKVLEKCGFQKSDALVNSPDNLFYSLKL